MLTRVFLDVNYCFTANSNVFTFWPHPKAVVKAKN